MIVEPIVVESNQNHATITQNGICPTLSAAMGLGGGYVPMIVEEKNKTGGNVQIVATHDARGNGNGDIACTITGNHQDRITDYTAIVAVKRMIGG